MVLHRISSVTTARPTRTLREYKRGGNGNNLDVDVSTGAGIDTTGNVNACIETDDGSDDVDVDGGDLKCGSTKSGEAGVLTNGGIDTVDVTDSKIEASDAISTGSEADTINVLRSMLTSSDDCVQAFQGDDTVNFTDTMCSAMGEGMELGSGDDTVNILRSHIICDTGNIACNAVEGGSGDEFFTVVESTLRSPKVAMDLDVGDDILTLGSGVVIEGIIDCDPDFDTIIFAMDVPEEALALFSSEIAKATLPDGSVTINGLFYEWEDCELLVNELVGVRVTRPIPTLSEWGLIAMAVAMGVFGVFFAVRRRSAVDAG